MACVGLGTWSTICHRGGVDVEISVETRFWCDCGGRSAEVIDGG